MKKPGSFRKLDQERERQASSRVHAFWQGATEPLVPTLFIHIPGAHAFFLSSPFPREVVWAHSDLRDVTVPKKHLIYL